MNSLFLLITFVFFVLAIWQLWDAFHSSSEPMFIGGLVCAMITVILLPISFAHPSGHPVRTETTQFTVEKTPYRIVVTAFGLEATLKDAYSVTNVDKIEKVVRTVQRNAWGVELSSAPNQPTIAPVFAK